LPRCVASAHPAWAECIVTDIAYRLSDLCVRHPGGAPDAPCVLKDFSLTLRRGEQVALIGPSGAGKTTLLAVLAVAHEPHAGSFEIFGERAWQLAPAARHALRRRLFLAPQVPPLPPRQRVVTAVLAGRLPRWSLGRAMRSLLRPTEIEDAWRALNRFDLGDKLWTRVDRLSGGERQRVSMTRMLIADTEVMLVDEPLSALDPRLASQTLHTIQEEATRRGATLVASLHQVELAHAQFPRVVGLRDGRVWFDLPRARVDAATLRDLYAGVDEADENHGAVAVTARPFACA
jgi:phosphonate transport system ATP-binding protein